MKQDEFLQLKHFENHQGIGLIPSTQESREWLEALKQKEPVNFRTVNPRDLKLHCGYFGMLAFIYDRLAPSFKKTVPKATFYLFLKMLSNEYKVVFKFKDGREFIEYESISFAKMNNAKFKEYFNAQLSVIYEELLIPLEQGYLMEDIEKEFEKMLSKLI